MMIPAIVLSSHTVGLGVIRALGSRGIPIVSMYYDKKDMGYVSKYVQEKLTLPHPEENRVDFLEALVEYGKKAGRMLLIPADDATLKVVSQYRQRLQEHFIVACPEWEVIEKIIDKKNTYELAASLGIPSPQTLIPASLSELDEGIRTLGFPCLVKPRQSHLYYEKFRTKMVKVENRDQLHAAWNDATLAGLGVMLQEYIPGDDTQGANYNSYFADGKPLVEFTAQKVRLSPPWFGVPCVVVSRVIDEVAEPGRELIRKLGFNGYSCTEFKKDPRDGVYKLMEVNGRHNRSTLLATKCGINFPLIEYRHLVNGEKPTQSDYREGVYWIDEFRDIDHIVKNRKNAFKCISEYIRPYLRRKVFSVFDFGDPQPFMKRCSDLAQVLVSSSGKPADQTVNATYKRSMS